MSNLKRKNLSVSGGDDAEKIYGFKVTTNSNQLAVLIYLSEDVLTRLWEV